jgi:4-amino-4-deoxy-L-arabinose transferase-like glycosyltransferase
MSRPVTWAAAGLVALTLLRLWVASVTPLAPDEAYYWIWSRVLAAGYVDHPPMVALWIRAGTALAGADPIGIRLFGALSAALGSILLYDAAERLFPGRSTGVIAALLLNATLAMGVGAVIMTPDTPLLLFWTATLWAGARLAAGGGAGWFLPCGLFAGLALTSKYTAAFLPLGLGLFTLIAAPRSFRHPAPWLGLLISGLVFSPVVLWNAEHRWAGFLRQGGRVADWRPERAVGFLVELVFGQIGLATPGVFVLFVAGLTLATRMTARTRDPCWTLLAALSVPSALVFLQHAMGDRVQGNWPVSIYPAAAIAAAGLTAPVATGSMTWRRWVGPSVAFGLSLTVTVYGHVVTGWPAWGGARDPVARQLFGWSDLAGQVERVSRTTGAGYVAAEPYGAAAMLAWTLPAGVAVVSPDPRWIPTDLPRLTGSRQGVLVRPDRYGESPNPAEWRVSERLPDLVRASGGVEIERYAVFLVSVASGAPPVVISPARQGDAQQ